MYYSQEVVDQVGDIIETAGDKAGSFITGLPMLTTRLLMAGLAGPVQPV